MIKKKKDTIKSLAIHAKDVGSTEIQIGLLTDKITKLSEHFKKFKKDLKRIFPKKNWNKLHLQIIYYGREYCKARECYGITCKICTSCYPNRKKPIKTKKA
jgi:ribosomal protein S15P/S13E